jgi:hypothetical protein
MTLSQKCENVLNKNWMGSFTIPSGGLYPFQWNWDSGFHALGWMHLNPERALIEMETLFNSQWENGFLPHIVFHNYKAYSSYFPSADYWEPWVSPYAIKNMPSSGITQPPIHGFILEHMNNKGMDKLRMRDLIKKTIEYHRYLSKKRVYKETELVLIYHNWESGMDNSVVWDEVFGRIPMENYSNISFQRKDIHEVSDSEETRPPDIDYQRYLYLLQLLKKARYAEVDKSYPFQVIEPVFNTIYLMASESLVRLGKLYDLNCSFIEDLLPVLKNSINKILWHPQKQAYYPYDVFSNKSIIKKYHGNFFPIVAQMQSKETTVKMLENYRHLDVYPFPSVYPGERGFESKKYWRGPVWVNINWMIYRGLLKYELFDWADWLKEETLKMVEQNGMYEYFSPFRNNNQKNGCGGKDFSWTAALTLDLIKS